MRSSPMLHLNSLSFGYPLSIRIETVPECSALNLLLEVRVSLPKFEHFRSDFNGLMSSISQPDMARREIGHPANAFANASKPFVPKWSQDIDTSVRCGKGVTPRMMSSTNVVITVIVTHIR